MVLFFKTVYNLHSPAISARSIIFFVWQQVNVFGFSCVNAFIRVGCTYDLSLHQSLKDETEECIQGEPDDLLGKF